MAMARTKMLSLARVMAGTRQPAIDLVMAIVLPKTCSLARSRRRAASKAMKALTPPGETLSKSRVLAPSKVP
jgi:hypothetical protein